MLELTDIQGIALSSYLDKQHALFVFLRIDERARRFLGQVFKRITSAESPKPKDRCLNIAFSAQGLVALGLDQATLASFPVEFVEGMSGNAKRSEILGDTLDSSPASWLWGSPSTPVHAVLMLYAQDADTLRQQHAELAALYEPGVEEVYLRKTSWLKEQREHFGFVDGISQPRVQGHPGETESDSALAAGEFVLGYPNEYGKLPSSPRAEGPIATALLPAAQEPAQRDLGKNGSYLVFRQIDQDVTGFWSSMLQAAEGDRARAVGLASKCVGRWPSGAPLTTAPTADDPGQAQRNDFEYREQDPHGAKCPVGAHIRRTNPRDSLAPNAEDSRQVVRRHSLLRRGRSYGAGLPPFSTENAATASAAKVGSRAEPPTSTASAPEERGLMFVCINANIARQFEFVQQTWINNPKFDGLYEDRDPLLGSHESTGGTFTIPGAPFRQRLQGLPRFTRVRGGEYFFLPSLRALTFLARFRD